MWADRRDAERRRALFSAARSGAPAAIEAWLADDAVGLALLEHAASDPPLAPDFAAAWARHTPPRAWPELLRDAALRWRDEEDRRRGDWVPPSEARQLARRTTAWLLDSLERATTAPLSRIEGALLRIEAEPDSSRARDALLRAQGELLAHDPNPPLAAWVELLLVERTVVVDPASCAPHLAALRRHVEGDAGAAFVLARFEAAVALRQGRYASGIAALERGLALDRPTAAPSALEELVSRWGLPGSAPSDDEPIDDDISEDTPDDTLSATVGELEELARSESTTSIARAVDALVTVVRWAELDTPELACAVGALWATLAEAEHEDAPELRSAFDRALARLAHTPATDDESALDVVARQLRERGLDEAAAIATTSRWAAWMDASVSQRREPDDA